MSLVGSTFGPSYSNRNTYSGYEPAATPQRAESTNPYQDLMQASRSDDAYQAEMSAFNDLLGKVRSLDNKPGDRDPNPGQVEVFGREDRYSLKRDGEAMKLSHTEVEPLPPGVFSIAGPNSSTTTYTILPDKIVKHFSTNRGADSRVVLDTVNGYMVG